MAYTPIDNQGTGNAGASPWSVSGNIFVAGTSPSGTVFTNSPLLMAGADVSGYVRTLLTDSLGILKIQGAQGAGVGIADNPIVVAGQNSGNVKFLALNSNGGVNQGDSNGGGIVSWGVQGSTGSGNVFVGSPILIGGSDIGAIVRTILTDGLGRPIVNQGLGNAAGSPWSVSGNVVGTKTNNLSGPGTTNIGTLPAVVNAASPTWFEGVQVALSVDLAGNLRTLSRFTATCLSGNATTILKGSAGTLHSVTINTRGATGNTLTLYDNASTAGGTKIANIDTTFGLITLNYNAIFNNGLVAIMQSGTAADLTITYS